MTAPFRVEVEHAGCPHCKAGRTFWVVGPDEVASSTSWTEEEDAANFAQDQNRAYEQGVAAGERLARYQSPEEP